MDEYCPLYCSPQLIFLHVPDIFGNTKQPVKKTGGANEREVVPAVQQEFIYLLVSRGSSDSNSGKAGRRIDIFGFLILS